MESKQDKEAAKTEFQVWVITICTLVIVIGLSFAAGVKIGQEQMWQEAVDHGVAVEETVHLKDYTPKTIYRWIELHDLGYEDPELPQ